MKLIAVKNSRGAITGVKTSAAKKTARKPNPKKRVATKKAPARHVFRYSAKIKKDGELVYLATSDDLDTIKGIARWWADKHNQTVHITDHHA